ncbi:MAG TPA: methylated-DNA--[protein]-cysteine S-methyltransferase [Cyclobacteriaceae bacterium]
MIGRGYYLSPVGDLQIESENNKITLVRFCREERMEEIPSAAVDQCIRELDEYFHKGRKYFTVDLDLRGNEFQVKAWNELLAIPYGKTNSYQQQAIRIGDPNLVRAVGSANNQNPIAIIVPCHRVIGKNGDLVGFGGGLENKEWLLQHEGSILKQLSLF